MSKGVEDLLNACTQSERERAEYNAKLPPEEATMSDEEAEFMDRGIAELVAAEKKARQDAGLSHFAGRIASAGWSLGNGKWDQRMKAKTEAETLEYLRTRFLERFLFDEDMQFIKTADGTSAKSTLSDINTAIAEVKEAGFWPWDEAGQFIKVARPGLFW